MRNLFPDKIRAFDYSAVEWKDVLRSIQTTARHDKRMQESVDSLPEIQPRERREETIT